MRNPVLILRSVAFLEAISFLLLLGIAMPLKHFAGIPEAVRIVGLIHGLLFIALCLVLWQVWRKANWSIRRALLVFVSAFIPFGPFLIDRYLHQYAAEYELDRRRGDYPNEA